MGFEVGNNVNKKISLEQLTNGLDPVKDKKKIDRITQIFDKYNTNAEGNSEKILDLDEQVSIMSDYHKTDKNNDGQISRKEIRQAGFAGEYKAYRDFMEAYQNALGEEESKKFELTINDETIDGQPYSDIKASQNATVNGDEVLIQHQYISGNAQTRRAKTTITTTDREASYSPKKQLLQQKVDGKTYRYRQYDSDAKNATPGVIVVLDSENQRQTVKLQSDGTYFDESGNSHYRLNKKMLLDEFTLDDKNRVTSERLDDKNFDYTYSENKTTPASIKVTDNQKQQKVYTNEKDLIYSTENNNIKEYFNFDQKTKVFTKTDAPRPNKHERQITGKKIRMTNGWRGQRQKLDNEMVSKINSMYTASEVLAELLKSDEYKGANVDEARLCADLIYNNPSMFDKDGNIYSDANWSRLDFPRNLTAYKSKE